MAVPTEMRPLGTLTVQQTGQGFSLSKSYITIGRVQSNDIILNDADVSRQHFSLTWDGQQYVVKDLGSTNGTFVNGQRIGGPQPLRNGDTLQVGGLTLTFRGFGVAVGAGEAQETHIRLSPQPTAPPPPPPAYVPPAAPPVRSTSWWLLAGAVGVLLLLLLATLGGLLLLQRPSATTVTITAPLNGSQVGVGQEMQILAVANDSQGVVRAELWVDNVQAGVVASPSAYGQTEFPVEFKWIPVKPGSHVVRVSAYNKAGKTGESSEVVVNAVESLVLSTGTAQAIATVAPDLTPTGCLANAAFVADVTIPDDSVVSPGQRLDKIWRLRNTGDCPWGSGYRLAYLSGDLLGASPEQVVPLTAPGGTADVQVTMYAPTAPGSYTGRWKLKDAAGQSFGTTVLIKIVVAAPETPLPPPTPSPPATPVLPPDTPLPPPCIPAIDFRVDDTNIAAGDHTTLRWDVECVQAVFLDGAPVVGHDTRVVSPPSTTTYTLRVIRQDSTTVDRQVTVNVHPPSGSVAANVTYHSYDAATGWVTFRIVNAPSSMTLECVRGRIVNRDTSAGYYGPGYSNSPFRSDPTATAAGEPSLAPGDSRYLRFKLSGSPTGVPCRATFALFAGDDQTGTSATETVDFNLPPVVPSVAVYIDYHSYDASTGWVTFRIRNGLHSLLLESAEARIVNRNTSAVYYGTGWSNTPFRPDPSSSMLESSLDPGVTKFMRYKLAGNPSGVPCRATIQVFTGDDRTGASTTRTVDFNLP